ncbi:MAG TPA: type II secretion system F family protein [Thermoguttaceae bacterium]|nr:type II secretion system F family protein [Thermoguttaceae bacterium]
MDNLFLMLAFVAGFLLTFGVNLVLADVFEANRQRVRKRLEEELLLKQRERARKSVGRQDPAEIIDDKWLGDQPAPTIRERCMRFVEESGVSLRPQQLAAVSLATSLLAGVVAGMLSGLWIVAAVAAVVGGALPVLYVFILRMRRLEKLLSQLPDAFDLMSRTLRAGQTTAQALQAVADEFSAPVAEEFGYCYDQQNLGLSPEAAMRDLARRTGLLELKIFVLAVMIHRQTGGNLADLLEKLAAVIRERYRIRGVIKALTAEGRLQALILLALPPGMLAVLSIINRPYMITLFEYPMLLVGMFVMMTVGGLWMKRIVSFDF